jgi:large subunit ribosomal protein L29
MTRATEFYAMDPTELESRLVEARRELLNLRFQLATGQLDNVARLKTVRRDVARVLTVLRAFEIAETEGVEFEAPTPRPDRVRAQRRDLEAARELEAVAPDEEIEEIEEIEDTEDTEVEPAPPRARARRSRKVQDSAEVPADADEEQ